MKKIFFLLLFSVVSYAQVSVGTTTPHSSAQFELSSTTKGFLPPRMTQSQRNDIPTPAAGLIVFCTNCGANGQMQVYNGTTWTNVIGGAAEIFASIDSLDCANATNNGILGVNTAASGISTIINYTGGNGGSYAAQSITSTGVTGLTATLAAGTFAIGSGTLTYNITGTPVSTGTASFAISIGGQSCILNRAVFILDRAYGQIINGANNHNFVYLPVTGADGNIWLNNNLGAHYANKDHTSFNPTQQATSVTDHLAYGSLFQWGRPADGHELITWASGTTGTAVNGTTTTRPGTDIPANNLFITINSGNFDWRGATQNDNLWQGLAGVNNPCPVGYRLPTNAQLTTLVTASSITNSTTAANTSLKFTVTGYRNNTDGTLIELGSRARYWSSSVSGTDVSYRFFSNSVTHTSSANRSYGFSVRCIKD